MYCCIDDYETSLQNVLFSLRSFDLLSTYFGIVSLRIVEKFSM